MMGPMVVVVRWVVKAVGWGPAAGGGAKCEKNGRLKTQETHNNICDLSLSILN